MTNYTWLNTKQAASLLAITPKALLNLVHRGKVKVYKLGTRNRYRQADLFELIQPVKTQGGSRGN